MRLVIDASVLIKWVLLEDGSPRVRELLSGEDDLLAPDLVWSEMASALWKRHRAGEYDLESTSALMRDLLQAPVRTQPVRALAGDILGYAMTLEHSPYDCAYLVLAEAEGCRVVTADRRFRKSVAPTPFSDRVILLGDLP